MRNLSPFDAAFRGNVHSQAERAHFPDRLGHVPSLGRSGGVSPLRNVSPASGANPGRSQKETGSFRAFLGEHSPCLLIWTTGESRSEMRTKRLLWRGRAARSMSTARLPLPTDHAWMEKHPFLSLSCGKNRLSQTFRQKAKNERPVRSRFLKATRGTSSRRPRKSSRLPATVPMGAETPFWGKRKKRAMDENISGPRKFPAWKEARQAVSASVANIRHSAAKPVEKEFVPGFVA